jgi:hypothetical protein
MSPLTHLFFKIFPTGTVFDAILIVSPISNRDVVNGGLNVRRWKYSITTTYFIKGGIDTKNLHQRIIGQWECMLGFIVYYHPPPSNNNMMITSMYFFHKKGKRKFHHPININRLLQVLEEVNLEHTCSGELEFFVMNPQAFFE